MEGLDFVSDKGYLLHLRSYLQKSDPAGEKGWLVVGEDQEPEADRHLDGQRLLPPFQPEPEGEAVEVLEGGRVRPDLGHGLGKARLEAPQRVRPERPAAPEKR